MTCDLDDEASDIAMMAETDAKFDVARWAQELHHPLALIKARILYRGDRGGDVFAFQNEREQYRASYCRIGIDELRVIDSAYAEVMSLDVLAARISGAQQGAEKAFQFPPVNATNRILLDDASLQSALRSWPVFSPQQEAFTQAFRQASACK